MSIITTGSLIRKVRVDDKDFLTGRAHDEMDTKDR